MSEQPFDTGVDQAVFREEMNEFARDRRAFQTERMAAVATELERVCSMIPHVNRTEELIRGFHLALTRLYEISERMTECLVTDLRADTDAMRRWRIPLYDMADSLLGMQQDVIELHASAEPAGLAYWNAVITRLESAMGFVVGRFADLRGAWNLEYGHEQGHDMEEA